MVDEVRDPRTFAIVGAAFEVHRVLGHGFLEAVYQEALEREFSTRGIPYRKEAELSVSYKAQALSIAYRADFVCHESVIVELKAIPAIRERDAAQVVNYLKATGFELGLLLNFGAPSLEYKRLIHSKTSNAP
jgi:GxxExxY protein